MRIFGCEEKVCELASTDLTEKREGGLNRKQKRAPAALHFPRGNQIIATRVCLGDSKTAKTAETTQY